MIYNFKGMIKQLSVFFIAGTVLLSCSEKPATSYVIEGELQGISDGTQLVLKPGATHKDEAAVGEASVVEGKFTFTGVADEPRLFYLTVADGYGAARIMVENGKIRLTGEVEKQMRGEQLVYNFDKLVVSGSKSHDLYLQKTNSRKALDSLYVAYHENNKEVSEALGKARMAKNQPQIDSLMNSDAYKKLAADEKHFFETVEQSMKGMIMENKDSWWGPFLMLDQMSYFSPDQISWYEAFSPEAKDSYYGKIVKEKLFPEGFVGKPLPAFGLVSKEGKTQSVAELSAGKKYLLVDFWASWCGPCRKEIPNLKNLYAKYASKGFEIISISIDKKEADWEKALKEEKLPWVNFLDTQGASEACKVKAIPAMFLIDAQGTVVAEKIRGEELEAKLAELMP